MDSVLLPSPPTQEPISIILDDELLDSQPKFALPPSSLSDLPPLVDSTLEKILSDLTPKEKLQSYHQDLAADEYMYKPTINEATRVTEHDIPVSTLSRPGKSNSLCKEKTETVIFEKYKSFPVSLEITRQLTKHANIFLNTYPVVVFGHLSLQPLFPCNICDIFLSTT